YYVTHAHGAQRPLPSFPTRRSSDLTPTVAAALTATAAEGDAAFAKDLLSGASDLDHLETASLTVANVTYTVDAGAPSGTAPAGRSEAHTSVFEERSDVVCRLLLVKE